MLSVKQLLRKDKRSDSNIEIQILGRKEDSNGFSTSYFLLILLFCVSVFFLRHPLFTLLNNANYRTIPKFGLLSVCSFDIFPGVGSMWYPDWFASSLSLIYKLVIKYIKVEVIPFLSLHFSDQQISKEGCRLKRIQHNCSGNERKIWQAYYNQHWQTWIMPSISKRSEVLKHK